MIELTFVYFTWYCKVGWFLISLALLCHMWICVVFLIVIKRCLRFKPGDKVWDSNCKLQKFSFNTVEKEWWDCENYRLFYCKVSIWRYMYVICSGKSFKSYIALGSSGGVLSLQVALHWDSETHMMFAQPLTAVYLVNESAACSDANPRTFQSLQYILSLAKPRPLSLFILDHHW